MSSITFGGLATGLDTDAIIEATMEVERLPVTRLENEKTYLDAELSAYIGLDVQLEAFQVAAEGLKTVADYTANSSASNLLSASADSSASSGVYNIEVVSLAKPQKDVSAEGFADADGQTLSGSLTIGEDTVDYRNVSLNELVDLINDTDGGVTASVINDGTENGYRLLLTGNEAGVDTTISGSGSLSIDTIADGHTSTPAQAHLIVDNVDIYSNSNTITSAIPGVDFDLYALSEPGETISLTIDVDTAAIEAKVNSFVTAYNDVMNYLNDQSDADWGNDSWFRSVKRQMQNLLTTQVETDGKYSSLSQLGIKTDSKTGTLSIDNETLSEAIKNDLAGVSTLLAGDANSSGIATKFESFLDAQTDADTGIHATREKSYNQTIKRIDNDVERMELRLAKREENLRAQYNALELLMSELNSQSEYLTQQFAAMESD